MQPGKLKSLNILAMSTTILFLFGCALGRQPIGDGRLTSTPEKLTCVDIVLKGERRFTNLTLQENIFSIRNSSIGVYDYKYSFGLKKSFFSHVYIRYPFMFGKPEVFFYIGYASLPRGDGELDEILRDTVENIKKSCPGFYVHGSKGRVLVDD